LLAGLDLLTGEIVPLVRDTHKSSDFIDFLKTVDKRYAEAERIKVVLDNHSAHTSKETRKYLEGRPGRFEFVFTPKHGSWLNLVESFFGKLARVCLRGIRVQSKEELVERIYRYIDEVNQVPVVYHWKYKMDEVTL
jgi:transposase